MSAGTIRDSEQEAVRALSAGELGHAAAISSLGAEVSASDDALVAARQETAAMLEAAAEQSKVRLAAELRAANEDKDDALKRQETVRASCMVIVEVGGGDCLVIGMAGGVGPQIGDIWVMVL